MWNCFLFSLVEKSVFSCEGMWSARGPYSGADLVACESVVAATECSEGFTFFSTFSFLPFHLVSTAWYLKAGLVSQPNSLWFLERPQRASGSGWREKRRKTAASQPTAALVSSGSQQMDWIRNLPTYPKLAFMASALFPPSFFFTALF